MFIHGKRKQCCQEGLHRVFYVITLPLAASTFYFSLFWVLSIPNFVDMFCDVRYVVQSCSYTLLTQFVNILSRYVNVMGKCNEYIIWQRVESPYTKNCFHNLNLIIVLRIHKKYKMLFLLLSNISLKLYAWNDTTFGFRNRLYQSYVMFMSLLIFFMSMTFF